MDAHQSWDARIPEWFVMWQAFAVSNESRDIKIPHLDGGDGWYGKLDWVERVGTRVRLVRQASAAPLAARCAAWGAVPSGISESMRTRRASACQQNTGDVPQVLSEREVLQLQSSHSCNPGNPMWVASPPTYESYRQWGIGYESKQRADMLDAGARREWLADSSDTAVVKGVHSVLLAHTEREHAKWATQSEAHDAALEAASVDRAHAKLAARSEANPKNLDSLATALEAAQLATRQVRSVQYDATHALDQLDARLDWLDIRLDRFTDRLDRIESQLGADGANGVVGADGANGVVGADGANGMVGVIGANHADGDNHAVADGHAVACRCM